MAAACWQQWSIAPGLIGELVASDHLSSLAGAEWWQPSYAGRAVSQALATSD
jgi:hypothetical protein